MPQIYITCIDWDSDVVTSANLPSLMSTLPSDIQARLKKFYHIEDSWRSLLGHLLPRYWLAQNDIPLRDITFGKTEYGKPLITRSPSSLSYNVTHDSDMVAIACESGNLIGIDAMRVALPRNTSMDEFVEFVSDQLSTREKHILQSTCDESTKLLHLYRMWTVKEAYTKALGEGVGYDFAKVEYDVLEKTVRVEGKAPSGWEITSFLVPFRADRYVVSVACQVGGEQSHVSHLDTPQAEWVKFVSIETLAEIFL